MYRVQKCDYCRNGHKDGIKILIIQGVEKKFCGNCGPQIKMVDQETGEVSTLTDIWHECAKDTD